MLQKNVANFNDEEKKFIREVLPSTSLDNIVTWFKIHFGLSSVFLHFDEVQILEDVEFPNVKSILGKYYTFWNDIMPLFKLPGCYDFLSGRAPALYNLGQGIPFPERRAEGSPSDILWVQFAMLTAAYVRFVLIVTI